MIEFVLSLATDPSVATTLPVMLAPFEVTSVRPVRSSPLTTIGIEANSRSIGPRGPPGPPGPPILAVKPPPPRPPPKPATAISV